MPYYYPQMRESRSFKIKALAEFECVITNAKLASAQNLCTFALTLTALSCAQYNAQGFKLLMETILFCPGLGDCIHQRDSLAAHWVENNTSRHSSP